METTKLDYTAEMKVLTVWAFEYTGHNVRGAAYLLNNLHIYCVGKWTECEVYRWLDDAGVL